MDYKCTSIHVCFLATLNTIMWKVHTRIWYNCPKECNPMIHHTRKSFDFTSEYALYRPSKIVIVDLSTPPEEGWGLDEPSPTKKAGCFGGGNAPSLLNILTTDDIVGLSGARFCTHNKPTCIVRSTSETMHELRKQGLMSSRHLPPLYSLHAWLKPKSKFSPLYSTNDLFYYCTKQMIWPTYYIYAVCQCQFFCH